MECATVRHTQSAKQSQVTQSEELAVAADHSVCIVHNMTWHVIKHMWMHIRLEYILFVGLEDCQIDMSGHI